MELKPKLTEIEVAYLRGIINAGLPLPTRTGRVWPWRCQMCGFETGDLEDYKAHCIQQHSGAGVLC